VRPEADHIHISRQIWQAVTDHALRSVARNEFCPEQSRIENLRPVFFLDEEESRFGKQIWCFEALGITSTGRRHVVYGMLEFSIQYGLIEPLQSRLFEESYDRDSWIARTTTTVDASGRYSPSTRFWIWSTLISVALLTLGWLATLVRYAIMMPSSGS
jgi:hypothetical protein